MLILQKHWGLLRRNNADGLWIGDARDTCPNDKKRIFSTNGYIFVVKLGGSCWVFRIDIHCIYPHIQFHPDVNDTPIWYFPLYPSPFKQVNSTETWRSGWSQQSWRRKTVPAIPNHAVDAHFRRPGACPNGVDFGGFFRGFCGAGCGGAVLGFLDG
jgi:hypothetical protein